MNHGEGSSPPGTVAADRGLCARVAKGGQRGHGGLCLIGAVGKQGRRGQSEDEGDPQERLPRGRGGGISGEQHGCGKAEGTGQLLRGRGDKG